MGFFSSPVKNISRTEAGRISANVDRKLAEQRRAREQAEAAAERVAKARAAEERRAKAAAKARAADEKRAKAQAAEARRVAADRAAAAKARRR